MVEKKNHFDKIKQKHAHEMSEFIQILAEVAAPNTNEYIADEFDSKCLRLFQLIRLFLFILFFFFSTYLFGFVFVFSRSLSLLSRSVFVFSFSLSFFSLFIVYCLVNAMHKCEWSMRTHHVCIYLLTLHTARKTKTDEERTETCQSIYLNR